MRNVPLNTLSQVNIQFHFVPPHAPNQGGIWEAAVKSFTYNFKRTVGQSILTFKEFYTSLLKSNHVLIPELFPECMMTPMICHILLLVISLLAKYLELYLILP